MCRQYLPGRGHQSLGMVFEKNADGSARDVPVGTSRRRYQGIDRVFVISCPSEEATMRIGTRKPWVRAIVILVGVLGVLGARIGYDRGFREQLQPDRVSATPEMRFKHGSIGAEHDAGVPYGICCVLPRIFPEKLRQDGPIVPGGYAALGVSWELGKGLPIGFTKKIIGFPRVADPCTVCHTTSIRATVDANPSCIVAGPAHVTNVEAFFRYLILPVRCMVRRVAGSCPATRTIRRRPARLVGH